MAETHFFMTESDEFNFIEFLIKSFGAEFVPATSSNKPPFPRYSQLAQLQGIIDQADDRSRFFVLSSLWEVYPLCFDELKKGEMCNEYFVIQRHGGPAFDFVLSGHSDHQSMRSIIPGSFSDYSYFIFNDAYVNDQAEYETFDRPPAMAQSYRIVQKYLRSKARRTVCNETGKTGPWALPGAVREFDLGTWLQIGDWSFAPQSNVS